MAINRLIRSLVIAVIVPASLSACVSLAGSQARIVDPRTRVGGLPGLPVAEALRIFAWGDDRQRHHLDRREYRDYVVTVYLAAIEANYSDFGGRVSSERRELGLGLDLVASAFTNYATVASTAIVNDLSAAAAGFAGARGALDRNVYFDRTVPALLASMDAQRARIRTRIAEGLRRNEVDYPLAAAFTDLSLLESAGSLDRALVSVTGQVAEERDQAERELAAATAACEVEADAVAVAQPLVDFIEHFRPDPDTDAITADSLVMLVRIASGMGVSPVGTGREVYTAINARISAGQNGRCSSEDLRDLIRRVEQATGRTI